MKSNLTKQLLKSLFTQNNNSFIKYNTNHLTKLNILNINQSIYPQQCKSININNLLSNKLIFSFSQQKKGPLKASQIPPQNLQVAVTQQKLDDQDIQVFHTKGSLSILDKVQGTKDPQSGQLYVLMFTCGQCNAKQIKSFTKNAYHKGIVLARCVGCQKIHLVADNLGWFEDNPVNVQTMHGDKVKLVKDHAAISAFLKKAFEQEQQVLSHAKASEVKNQQVKEKQQQKQ